MNLFIDRLLRAETSADKEEFVRGVAGLDKNPSTKRILIGILAGTLLAAARRDK